MAVQGDPHGTIVLHVAGLGHEIVVHDIALQGVDDDAVAVLREGDPEQHVVGREPDASGGVPSQGGGGMGVAPGVGHPLDITRPGKGFQVQNLQASRSGNPQSSEPVFAALADDVSDGNRMVLFREPDERISVISDQSSAEGTDPGIPPAVEINAVDILVRKPVLPGQPVDDQIVLCTRLSVQFSGGNGQAEKNCQNKIHLSERAVHHLSYNLHITKCKDM